MATSQVSSIMLQAKAAVEASYRLLAEMRIIQEQVNENATALRNSAYTLASNMSATVAGATKGDVSTVRAPIADRILIESPTASASLPDSHPRQLDSKDQTALDSLTPREIEVLRLIGEGHRTKEIAFTLGITFKTAVTHRSNIMEKLGIHEGPRLVRFAIRTGIATA